MRPVLAVALVVALIDVLVFDNVFPTRTFRLSVHLRPLIIVGMFRDVRHVFFSIAKAMPQLLRVLSVSSSCVSMFTRH